MKKLFSNLFGAWGLRTHVFIISGSLIFLTVILGVRAYSVARSQFEETRDLVTSDLRAQPIFVQIEAAYDARTEAQKKWNQSLNPKDSASVAHEEMMLRSLIESLQQILGANNAKTGQQANALSYESPQFLSDLHILKKEVENLREIKLRRAHDASRGLLHLILVAFILSAAINTWLIFFFRKGLIEPLGSLEKATAQIKSGDLHFRLPDQHGVRELNELSRAFNSMAARLESLDRAKTEFLETISHEIKNPLAALKEGLSLLSHQDTLSESARKKGFSACLIASKRVELMINNLLNLSREEKGLFDFDLSLKNLPSAIQTAIDEVRPMAEKKGMQIQLHAPSELRASFNWDGMVQVLENLFLNAIKYGQEGTLIEVEAFSTSRPIANDLKLENQLENKKEMVILDGELISAESAESRRTKVPHVEVSVTNQGKNIALSETIKIFDRFYRGSNSSRQQGLGIGLHVVKQIIEAHHGTVKAFSDAGKTKFSFWIPGEYETV